MSHPLSIREAGVEITVDPVDEGPAPIQPSISTGENAERPAKRARRAATQLMCIVCNTSAAKYTCPRCATRTCSLQCVRKHKADTGCNGKRDKTAFISIKQFNTNHLVSDLHFLEEVEHTSERAKTYLKNVVGSHSHQPQPKNSKTALNEDADTAAAGNNSISGKDLKSSGASHAPKLQQNNTNSEKRANLESEEMFHHCESSKTGGGPKLPVALLKKRTRRERLLVEAALQRNTELILLSAGMQRRKENTSHWNKKEDVIYWRVVWILEGSNKITMDGADDRKSVNMLATEYGRLRHHKKSEEASTSSSCIASNKFYYFLRKERCPANDQRYYRLGDGSISLKESLKNRVLVEHPTIWVCTREEDAPPCIEEVTKI